MKLDVGTSVLRAVQDDLTKMEVGVVVNAANETLAHGGGVAAALARAGGPKVQQESDDWVAANGEVKAGNAAVTSAGTMPSRWIVHVVGPRFGPGQDNARLLNDAVWAALSEADKLGAKSVAMPAISAGIFGYPPDEATKVITRAAFEYLGSHPAGIADVHLVGYDQAMADRFALALRELA